MERNIFVRITSIHSFKREYIYITSPDKQEHLLAVYETTNTNYWGNLTGENHKSFNRYNPHGKCVEVKEMILALPERFATFDPDEVIKEFTEAFHKKYGVECIGALHYNKAMNNLHIHMLISERILLPEPTFKIATKNIYLDKNGRRSRRYKVVGENGKLLPKCKIIRKGEVYDIHRFSKKIQKFNKKSFLHEIKNFYANLINSHLPPEEQLSVYDPGSCHLHTIRTCKGNPKTELIKATNEEIENWNKLADTAINNKIPPEKVLERKKEIMNCIDESEKENGRRPDLYHDIVVKGEKNLIADILKYILKSTEQSEFYDPEPYSQRPSCLKFLEQEKHKDEKERADEIIERLQENEFPLTVRNNIQRIVDEYENFESEDDFFKELSEIINSDDMKSQGKEHENNSGVLRSQGKKKEKNSGILRSQGKKQENNSGVMESQGKKQENKSGVMRSQESKQENDSGDMRSQGKNQENKSPAKASVKVEIQHKIPRKRSLGYER